MKFYIAKDAPVFIYYDPRKRVRFGKFPVTYITPSSSNENSEVARKISKKLEVALGATTDTDVAGCSNSTHPKIEPSSNQRQGFVHIRVRFDKSNPLDTEHSKIPVYVSGVNVGLFSHLENVLQLEAEDMKMKITGHLMWKGGASPEAKFFRNFGSFETNESFMDLSLSDDVYKFEDGTAWLNIDKNNFTAGSTTGGESPREIWNNRNVIIRGKFTVELIVDDLNEDFYEDKDIRENKMLITRKLLNEQLGCDVKIVADNGTIIPCHKGFLSAHSQVFASMLNGNFKEAETNEIKMPGKTENGIRALLSYLYHWDTSAPADNPILAVELYKIGHEYDIKLLQTCMVKILEKKNLDDWLDAEMALSLFPCVGGNDDKDYMKLAVYRFFQKNAKKLPESDRFKELFEKRPSLAMNLFAEVCGWKETI